MNLKHLAGCCMARNGKIQSQPNETHCKGPKDQAEVVVSCDSLNALEDESFKDLLPQVTAAVVVMSYHIVMGISYGYSAILIPQLLDEQKSAQTTNSTDTAIDVTESDTAWIASILITIVLPASLIGGVIIDYLGRLNALKLSTIPNAVGWILIAAARTGYMLVVGNILTGIGAALGICPAIVYVAEISSPDIRGALASIGPCLFSFGLLLANLEGWFINWRTLAWIALVYSIIPVTFVILWLPESPAWLVTQNRTEQANKSLKWLNRFRKRNNTFMLSYNQEQLSALEKEHVIRQKHSSITKNRVLRKLKMFFDPTVYKPLLILTVLYFFQEFAGLPIFLFYSVLFFNALDMQIRSELASIIVCAVRFAFSVVAVFLFKRFRRRPLIMLSGLGMSFSIGLFGICISYIKEGQSIVNWSPFLTILLYVSSSMFGFLSVPWIITSELFPTPVRGVGSGLALGIAYTLTFASLRFYSTLVPFFGESHLLHYFYAVMLLFGVLFIYIFLPETHHKSLSEIQEHFRQHWTYITTKRIATVTFMDENHNAI